MMKTLFKLELDTDDLLEAFARGRALAERIGSQAVHVRGRDLFLWVQEEPEPDQLVDGAGLVGRAMWRWYDRLGLPDLDFEVLGRSGPRRDGRLRHGGWLASGEWADHRSAERLVPGGTACSLEVLLSPGGLGKDAALLHDLAEDETGGGALVTIRALLTGVEWESLLDHLPALLERTGATSIDLAPVSTGGWWVEIEHPSHIPQDRSAVRVLRDSLAHWGLDVPDTATVSEDPHLAAVTAAVPAGGVDGLPGCTDLFAFASIAVEEAVEDRGAPRPVELEATTMTDAESLLLQEALQEYKHSQAQILVVLATTCTNSNQGDAEERTRQLAQQLNNRARQTDPSRSHTADRAEITLHSPEGDRLTYAYFLIDTPADSPRAIASTLTTALSSDVDGHWDQLTPHLTSGHVHRTWHPDNPPHHGVRGLSLHVARVSAVSREIAELPPGTTSDDEPEPVHTWLRQLRPIHDPA